MKKYVPTKSESMINQLNCWRAFNAHAFIYVEPENCHKNLRYYAWTQKFLTWKPEMCIYAHLHGLFVLYFAAG